MWHLYLVRCADGSLYTGISTDVQRRFDAHQNNRGARRLRGRGPLQLVFSQAVGDRGEAQRVEYQVKKLSRVQKERLIRGETALPLPTEISSPSEHEQLRRTQRRWRTHCVAVQQMGGVPHLKRYLI